MKVLILGICHEIFFFGKKRSKIRLRIIHRRALYTGKYGKWDESSQLLLSLSNSSKYIQAKLIMDDLIYLN